MMTWFRRVCILVRHLKLALISVLFNAGYREVVTGALPSLVTGRGEVILCYIDFSVGVRIILMTGWLLRSIFMSIVYMGRLHRQPIALLSGLTIYATLASLLWSLFLLLCRELLGCRLTTALISRSLSFWLTRAMMLALESPAEMIL